MNSRRVPATSSSTPGRWGPRTPPRPRRRTGGSRRRLLERLSRSTPRERGCVVVGVELDPEAAAAAQTFCEDVLVGDVESMELPLEPASFDVVALR